MDLRIHAERGYLYPRPPRPPPPCGRYARVVGNFSQVVVRAAGHIVPGDQPERALDMITRFVEGRGYKNLPDPAHATL